MHFLGNSQPKSRSQLRDIAFLRFHSAHWALAPPPAQLAKIHFLVEKIKKIKFYIYVSRPLKSLSECEIPLFRPKFDHFSFIYSLSFPLSFLSSFLLCFLLRGRKILVRLRLCANTHLCVCVCVCTSISLPVRQGGPAGLPTYPKLPASGQAPAG